MISIHVPKGSRAPDLNKELSSTKNIQDKKNRDQTMTGLRTISKYL